MKKNQILYPLKFEPQLKERVWGGDKLQNQFGKKGSGNIGESWEISGVEGSISVATNGWLKGSNLSQLISTYKERILGGKVYHRYGTEFPLLFKFIDAREDLSVQLHPNDMVARKRHGSSGKTEMWYLLEVEEDARLILGFDKEVTKGTYLKHLAHNSLAEILGSRKVKKGDAFFIAPGTVHAIGAGVVLAEIQQTSDITYRIHDWNRPGLDGNLRELHNDMALDVINFDVLETQLRYVPKKNETVTICQSSYFETNLLHLTKPLAKNLKAIDSFMVYMCTEGTAVIKSGDISEQIKKGDTLLIPAEIDILVIQTEGVTLLEVYVP